MIVVGMVARLADVTLVGRAVPMILATATETEMVDLAMTVTGTETTEEVTADMMNLGSALTKATPDMDVTPEEQGTKRSLAPILTMSAVSLYGKKVFTDCFPTLPLYHAGRKIWSG